MNKFRITMIDSMDGEVYTEHLEIHGWPVIADPYIGISGRTGYVIKIEKLLIPSMENIYQ